MTQKLKRSLKLGGLLDKLPRRKASGGGAATLATGLPAADADGLAEAAPCSVAGFEGAEAPVVPPAASGATNAPSAKVAKKVRKRPSSDAAMCERVGLTPGGHLPHGSILTRLETLQRLAEIARDSGEATKDRIMAMKVSNEMQGFNAPEEHKVSLSGFWGDLRTAVTQEGKADVA